MKILIVHNRYQSNNVGGEDIVFDSEVEALQSKLGRKNVFTYEVSNDSIKKLNLLFSIWFSLKHYFSIKKIISNNNIDILHAHNFFPLLTPSIFKAAKKSKAKTILTLHNYRIWCVSGILYRDGYGVCELCVNNIMPVASIKYACYRGSKLQTILTQLAFVFFKITDAYKHIDYYLALTPFQMKKVTDMGISKQQVILKPNFTKINDLLDTSSKDRVGFLYVGRVEESKGILDVLELWASSLESEHLTIIGTGVNISSIMDKYKNHDNIVFMGACPRSVVQQYMQTSRFLLQPSLLYETFGLTIIEAMANSLPVIGSNIGTRADFITNNVNGLLYEKDGFVCAIKKASSILDSKYNKMSFIAYQDAKMYDKSLVIEKQIKIYKDILEL